MIIKTLINKLKTAYPEANCVEITCHFTWRKPFDISDLDDIENRYTIYMSFEDNVEDHIFKNNLDLQGLLNYVNNELLIYKLIEE